MNHVLLDLPRPCRLALHEVMAGDEVEAHGHVGSGRVVQDRGEPRGHERGLAGAPVRGPQRTHVPVGAFPVPVNPDVRCGRVIVGPVRHDHPFPPRQVRVGQVGRCRVG